MQETKTIGDLMNDQRRGAMRGIALVMAVLLYAAVLIYTGVHNFNLISRTVPADQQAFAVIAILCLEGAAVFLPIAIHFWLAPGAQRSIGYILYAVNWLVVIGNTILDSMTNKAQTVPQWMGLYAEFIVPAAPIFIGVGVTLMFLLDPEKKIHDARASAKAAAIDATAIEMRQAAGGADANAMVRSAAHESVMSVVSGALGKRQQPALQSATVQMNAEPNAAALPDKLTPDSMMFYVAALTPAEREKFFGFLKEDYQPDSGAGEKAPPLE